MNTEKIHFMHFTNINKLKWQSNIIISKYLKKFEMVHLTVLVDFLFNIYFLQYLYLRTTLYINISIKNFTFTIHGYEERFKNLAKIFNILLCFFFQIKA